jgi:hypothetical protein
VSYAGTPGLTGMSVNSPMPTGTGGANLGSPADRRAVTLSVQASKEQLVARLRPHRLPPATASRHRHDAPRGR